MSERTGTEIDRGSARSALAAAAALTLLAVLAFAPLARAAYDPLGSGTTRIVFAKPFLAFLKKDKVKLATTKPARLKAGALTLPVSGGAMDPTTGKGEIDDEGALVFRSARKSVPFKNFTVKTKHSPLTAKVGGGQLKVATAAKIASVREDFGTGFSAKKLKLTAKVATRLNKKLRPRAPFAAGQVIGFTKSRTQPQTITILATNRATLFPDPAFLAKLDGLFVSLNPIAPAERAPGPTFSFPIVAGGAIAPDASLGTLRTGGDVEFLQLGAGQVFWHEQWLDLGAGANLAEVNVQPSPPYPGKLGQIPILDLGAGAVVADRHARTIAVSGAPLNLNAQTAASFNQAFAQGKEAFRAGEALGSLSFTAQGQ
jgi:hypothetical protein